jgi:SecD/SecF fusion protein
MQLKGLVRFFAIALILICLYQLSFTWFVKSHEGKMEVKAEQWVKNNYPSADAKYPGNTDLQKLYKDTLEEIKQQRLQVLLDSTKKEKIALGLFTYQYAKNQELLLGLDLQGGMNVTMEVGLDGLLRSLANNSKDPAFTKALEAAVARKATGGADLLSLFQEEFGKQSNAGNLAPLFVARSNGRIKFDASNSEVMNYLRSEAKVAFNNTFNILQTRIDGFGVASPTINADENKGTITVELAGIKDPERVRKKLQSSANLQFYEVYTLQNFGETFIDIEKAVAAYLNGTDTATTIQKDSASTGTTVTADSNKVGSIADLGTGKDSSGKKTSTASLSSEDSARRVAPLRVLMSVAQPIQDEKTGKVSYRSPIGYIAVSDTSKFNGYLRLEVARAKIPANAQFVFGKFEGGDETVDNILSVYVIKIPDNGTPDVSGEHIEEATQSYTDRGRPSVSLKMNGIGTTRWAKMTERNVGKPIAIVLDNFVYSAPNVNNAITQGVSEISGSFTIQEAQDLADILKSGKLPAPAKIVQEQLVGPTLGEAAIAGGSLSFLISFLVIFVLMLVYYNTAGWVANIALILNLFFTIGILSALGATLTAPGIAGLVLTIGMAVDTNVIIFERIKEELTKGKSYASAVKDGYTRSLAPVLDAHVTTLLTAIILFYFGLGPVKGFATTQILGILLSLFCGILFSRLITDWWTTKNRHFEYFTGVSRRVFKHAKYKFIEYRKIAYGVSFVILGLGIAAIFHGFDYGVEFAGGRSYTVKFSQPQDVEAVRTNLEKTFGETPIIKTVGSKNQLNITTAFMIDKQGEVADSTVETALYNGIKTLLANGKEVSYADYKTVYRQKTETVLPTISADLKKGAIKATILSILAICLYIFIRFRDWRYSLGTIVALLHDVLVTLAVFSFLREIVPFPLEIDQHFIAAVLTVIGFSMNDTVIVFDRIREYSHQMKGANRSTIINSAINDTLSRTIMTSLTVFLTILILFFFGGEVTKGFAFAMTIGVFVGTYSSIFVAAPILMDFGKKKPLGEEGLDNKA